MSSSDPATPEVEVEVRSIYSLHSSWKKALILILVSLISLLCPFADTMYLPSLPIIVRHLHTSQTLGVLSISLFFLTFAVFGLLWGSLSDRYGRRWVTISGLGSFCLFSLGCYFSPTIGILLVFRALQGAAIAVALIVGTGTIADIYPPAQRGLATGIFFIAFSVGPIIGPLIGGPLSHHFGWRSNFICLTTVSFVLLLLYIIFVPETFQHTVIKRYNRNTGTDKIGEAENVSKPVFHHPWKTLVFLSDLSILPYQLMLTSGFASIFIALTLHSSELERKPYGYNEKMVGVLYVPIGVASFLGSIIGGRLSDLSARQFSSTPEGRLLPALFSSLLLPVGLLLFGWSFHRSLPVQYPLIGMSLCGFGQTANVPGIYSYFTIINQAQAARIISLNNFIRMLVASVGVTVAIPLMNALKGIGPLFSLLAALNVVTTLLATRVMWKRMRAGQKKEQATDGEKRETTAATVA